MDFQMLYKMQKQLDNHIEAKHQLEDENVLDRKILAFHVELAELANETRCFKFWSEKAPSDDAIILEEYVDGIHFILSIGIEYGYDNETMFEAPKQTKKTGEALVPYFFEVINATSLLREKGDKTSFDHLFTSYLTLGEALGFSANNIIDAYKNKNEVNYQRQQQGY
ncbi:dUTP diphosphatase [Evansella cellulosilytica]|uniref:dUTPase n=1 Tax=Evansella cellulosilytica (strain ATCC 21833 / DSM 2522 / FERM P-1141 / JCM 9156 / N-4) TaxID=649639 RepID=E6U0I7_EVAC2|nr:dUTP diphosphatase [Evansella cellulosilytica]ADU31432.1 dUTPase [Evansella cellulosilytica DSM 2522]